MSNINEHCLYKNGSMVKPVANRRVSVFKDPNIDTGVRIEFAKADVDLKDINTPCSINTVIRNKIQVTGIILTEKAAYALICCLHDYFTRVVPVQAIDDSS